ncbi:hypothetical protein H6503_02635 [Candidatus Woesearchaeota archaeon]|nr:hypothetical protein [Candidatus Woesearchaeota archaeon]
MKAIVFDSGPVITFALNSLLDIIPFLRDRYDGIFYLCNAVHKELIEAPSRMRKFAFESMRVKKLIGENEIEVFDTSVYSEETEIITEMANSIFSIKNKNLNILNPGEIDALVLAKNINADALVVDERTTRLLLENPMRLHAILQKKFNKNVRINKERLKEFHRHFSTLKIIRSVELALIAFELDFFEDYLKYDTKENFVEALLWAMKLNGCAVSEREIKVFTKLYKDSNARG